MSEQLAAAAAAMKVPEPLVDRSARAWADASGATVDEVLAAWAGGTGVVSAPAEAAEGPPVDEATPSEAEAPGPVEPVAEAPAPVPQVAAVEAVDRVPEPGVDPLPLGARIRLAGRIGAWTGALLGLVGFLVGSPWLLPAASLAGEEGALGAAVEVTTSAVLIGVVGMSVLFGIVVATLSRAAAAWFDRGAGLVGGYPVTVLIGLILGLVLGVAAGAVMLSAFAVPLEGVEGAATMSVLPSLFVVLVGGALLGWLTATLVQVAGVPAGVTDEDAEEIAEVRGRLAGALRIPGVALLTLLVLVLPLGMTFIRSNELAQGGAAILAIVAAGGVLGFAALSASRPSMRISMGEFMVAAAGIATVVVIIFAVVSTMAGPHDEEVPAEDTTEEPVDEAPEPGISDDEAPAAEPEATASIRL